MDARALTELMEKRKKFGAARLRIPLSIEVRKVMQALMFTLGGLFLGLSVFYLYQTSTFTEQGISLKSSQITNAQLEAENRELKQKVLNAQTMETLTESPLLKQMIELLAPVYLPKETVTLRRAP